MMLATIGVILVGLAFCCLLYFTETLAAQKNGVKHPRIAGAVFALGADVLLFDAFGVLSGHGPIPTVRVVLLFLVGTTLVCINRRLARWAGVVVCKKPTAPNSAGK